MPFDPTGMTLVEEPAEKFDPTGMQLVDEESPPRFDASQMTLVEDEAPKRTLADFMAQPDSGVTESSPVTQGALPVMPGGTLGAIPKTEEETIQAQVPEGDVPNQIGVQQATLPRLGAEDSFTAGVSDTFGALAEWLFNKPEEIALTFTPAKAAVAARYTPEVAKQFGEDIVAAMQGDRRALGRVVSMGVLVLSPEAFKRMKERAARGAVVEKPPALEQGNFPEVLEPGRREQLVSKSVEAFEQTTGEKPSGGATDASKIGETKTVDGDVLRVGEENRQAKSGLPVDEGGAGVRTQVEVIPEPAVSPLAPEAHTLVDSGGVPTVVTRNLRRIAEENGIEVTDQTTPNEIVDALKTKANESSPTPASDQAAPQTAESEGAQGAITGASLSTTPAGGSGPIKGLHEIAADLAKGLGVPIRFGRLTTPKFGGYFKAVQNLIGSKRAVDMPTVSHEVGHKLDSRLSLSADKSLTSELNTLGDPATPGSMSSWTKSKSTKYKMGEGVAEFVRYWLTDPAEAKTKAPNTLAAFEKAMDANPDWGDVMRRAQSDVQLWRGAQFQMRLRSHVSVGENPNGTPYRLRQLTRDLVDDLHYLRLAVDDAQRMSGAKLNPMQNIYVLARNLRGAFGRADTFIRNGVVDFNTRAVKLGTSLEDALKPVAGHIDDFRDWIIAKRAQELHSQGRQTGLLQADVDATAARFDKVPEFNEAFQKVKDWQSSLLKYLEDSGFISEESRLAMEDINKDYVPFHRLFEIGAGETPSQEAAGTGRGLNVGKPGSLKTMTGSVRPIVDPLETMIKNAYVLTLAAEKGWLHSKLADMANMPGMGKWIEEITTPKQMQEVALEKVRDQLEKSGADLTGVPDDLMLAYFTNSRMAPFGENIIRVMKDGKPKFFRLNSDLFDTFHALDMESGGRIVEIISKQANLLRAGVTLAPDFALANAMRDAFGSAIVSKNFLIPGEAVIRGVAAMIGNPKVVAEWAASGGKHAVEANYFDRTKLQEFMKEKITKDLTPVERALIWAKSPLTALRFLTGAAEEATRIGEYQVAYNKLLKSGMSEGDARTMAAFESRDRQDFSKGGAKTKALRMLTPFWNAGLQANVKLAQAFKERPVKTALAGIAFITLPKLFEQAVNYDDQDYWDRPQWERDLFFLFPIGKDENKRTKFLRIPTPFEPGIIFGTLPGRIVQYMKENDPKAFEGFANTILQQTVPNPIPPSLEAIFETKLAGKQGWDIFRGRHIVPDALAGLPPDLQFTEQTSVTAKKIGQLAGMSPMKVDHLIARMSGGLGKQITYNLVDPVLASVTGEPMTAKHTMPGGRFMTSPAGTSSQSIEDFYENYYKITAEEARIKQTEKGEDWAGLAKAFRKASDDLSVLRKAARKAETDMEKQAYYLEMVDIAKEMNKLAKEQKVR